MNTLAGLWIDHRRAVVACVTENTKEVMEIRSHAEKHPGHDEGVHALTPFESQRVQTVDSHHRTFTGHLEKYYEHVISVIKDSEFVLIFGPGEAKGELKHSLEHAKYKGQIIAVETTDKMTHHQILQKVQEYFQANKQQLTVKVHA